MSFDLFDSVHFLLSCSTQILSFFLFGSASPSQLKNLFFAVRKSFIKQPFPITAILWNILSVCSVWAIGLEEKHRNLEETYSLMHITYGRKVKFTQAYYICKKATQYYRQ